MQEQTSEAARPTPDSHITAARDGGEAALREELAKWRERVPKLAQALRQRAEETEALKLELGRLRADQSGGQAGGAGVRAREELIRELEGKLTDLAERHKVAQGELHARALSIEELKADVVAWKEKWQGLARSLDEQAEQVEDRLRRSRHLEDENAGLKSRLADQLTTVEGIQQALDEAVAERDSLARRNEQLFETTEFANRQIASLTDSLSELRAELAERRERDAERQAELDAAGEARQALAGRLQGAEQEVLALSEDLAALQSAAVGGAEAIQAMEDAMAQVRQARDEAQTALEEARAEQGRLETAVAERDREVARLTEVVGGAQRVTSEREEERRVLSEQIHTLESRTEYLEKQLAERSALVVALEQDLSELKGRLETAGRDSQELEERALRAERHAREHAEHITALDGKLERQQQLMLELEAELAESGDEHARALKARSAELAERDAQVQALKDQVRKLETLVRERTEVLNQLRWKGELSEQQATARAAASDGDNKMLLVLNQQLDDARRRNDELARRVRSLEEELAWRAHQDAGDDLTRIHGVGPKLAEQLNELGIFHFDQIANLEPQALDAEDHVLHAHRGRILRDGWIEQAAQLIRH